MNSLRKKILFLLISIFSFFLLFIFIVFNFSVYNKEKKEVKDQLNRISSKEISNSKNPIFMDNNIYVVSFDVFGGVDKIISYSSSKLTDSEISKLIKRANRMNKNEIGSLYLNDYVLFLNNQSLIIIDNKRTKSFLLGFLFQSLVLFIVLEVIIMYLSFLITKWIVKPVSDAFFKQKQFIDDASHELKTPIAIIQASAETLENNPGEMKWLENIKSETSRMDKLVSNLLVLSKMDNTQNNEVYFEVDLSNLVRSKALSFESLMFENDLSLKLDVEDGIVFNCDGDRVKELLGILIDNAIKHGEVGSDITISLYKEKSNIVLCVKNKGDEVPLNEREKIFERFYRVNKSRNRDENRYGLGLSIAKNIVMNHNGNIKVECKDGYTAFVVVFKCC